MSKVLWLADAKQANYLAAWSYLSILLDEERAEQAVRALKRAGVTSRRANDCLRACGRDPLPADDPGVRRTLNKIRKGSELAPVLLVSWEYGADVADGLHRLSAIYGLDPFTPVLCRLAHMPELENG